MIGIIGAMELEIQGLRARLDQPETSVISGVRFDTGSIHGVPVVLAVCGVGKVFAALCAQTMILRFPVHAVINTGVAGTLCSALGIGDVALASDVVQHDMDTSPLGDPVGMISGPNLVHLPADGALTDRLAARAASLGLHCQVGTIATGDQFLAQAERKRWIHETFGAIAGEMEGGSIGQVCYVNHIPFAVLRTISDGADGSAPESFPAFAAAAAADAVEIVDGLLEEMSRARAVD